VRRTTQELAQLERLVPRVGLTAAAHRLGRPLGTVTRWARELDLPRPTRPSRRDTDATSAALLWAEATGA
jgi:hypothetical protein